jgi:hypothetical protein
VTGESRLDSPGDLPLRNPITAIAGCCAAAAASSIAARRAAEERDHLSAVHQNTAARMLSK